MAIFCLFAVQTKGLHQTKTFSFSFGPENDGEMESRTTLLRKTERRQLYVKNPECRGPSQLSAEIATFHISRN